MDTLRMTNYIIAVVFFVCYAYQFLYIPVPWLLAKRKAAKAAALEKALVDTSLRSAEKRERVEATLGVEKAYKKLAKAVSGAMVGYAAEFAHVFLTEAEGSKFALSNDEKVEAYVCPDEGRDLFDAMRVRTSPD